MYKTLFFEIFFLLLFSSSISIKAQSDPSFKLNGEKKHSFNLNGTCNDTHIRKLYLTYYSDLLDKGITDSSNLSDNQFSFKINIGTPAFAYITLIKSQLITDSMWTFYIDTADMKIDLATKPYVVKKMVGSVAQQEFEKLQQARDDLKEKYKTAFELYKLNEGVVNDSLQSVIDTYFELKRKEDFSFFFAYPNSIVTSFGHSLYYRKVSLDTLESLFELMNEKVQKSVYGKRLSDFIFKENTLNIGKPAPGFSSLTEKGEDISLSQYKGEIILLDFWAHWCIPCRQSFPELIALNNKYKNKGFKIIGIASDDFARDKWLEAIDKDGIGIWDNILDGIQKNQNGEVDLTNAISRKYNVGYLPTKVLIDRNGKIVGRYVGDKEEKLLEQLKTIFGY